MLIIVTLLIFFFVFISLVFVLPVWILYELGNIKRSEKIIIDAEKRLQEYLKNNTIKMELKNPYLEMRFVGSMFYCKERTNGIKPGRFFYINGRQDHINATWGLINGYFKHETKYDDIKKFYLDISRACGDVTNPTTAATYYIPKPTTFNQLKVVAMHSRNDKIIRFQTRYFLESKKYLYPDFILNQVQNEYCRLSVIEEDEHKYILCEEIWGTRKFIIETSSPESLIAKFRTSETNKMLQYTQLLKYYKNNSSIKVIEVQNSTKTIKTEKQIPQQSAENLIIDKNSERNIDF